MARPRSRPHPLSSHSFPLSVSPSLTPSPPLPLRREIISPAGHGQTPISLAPSEKKDENGSIFHLRGWPTGEEEECLRIFGKDLNILGRSPFGDRLPMPAKVEERPLEIQPNGRNHHHHRMVSAPVSSGMVNGLDWNHIRNLTMNSQQQQFGDGVVVMGGGEVNPSPRAFLVHSNKVREDPRMN